MRVHFNDLDVNDVAAVPVIFKSVSARETKTKKPYLQVSMFDGTTSIDGNYWDWSGKAMPDTGVSVYTATGQMTTYQGNKQFTIKGITTNTELDISDFAPASSNDLNIVFKDAYAFISDVVKDDFLRDITLTALDVEMDKWLKVPGAVSIHHAYVGGTLIHCLSVAKIAYAISKEIPIANQDLCIVGGMLHDIGKLYTYDFNGAAIIMTPQGKMFEHLTLGAMIIKDIAIEHVTIKKNNNFDKLDLLTHIILSHHGDLENGAVTTPQCIEAQIVHSADMLDATAEVIRSASITTSDMWTDKVWTMHNRPAINHNYIKDLFVDLDDMPFK